MLTIKITYLKYLYIYIKDVSQKEKKIITEESKTYKTLGSTEAVSRDYPFSALNPVPEHINNLRSSFAVVRDVLGSYT